MDILKDFLLVLVLSVSMLSVLRSRASSRLEASSSWAPVFTLVVEALLYYHIKTQTLSTQLSPPQLFLHLPLSLLSLICLHSPGFPEHLDA